MQAAKGAATTALALAISLGGLFPVPAADAVTSEQLLFLEVSLLIRNKT
jgi:hypothetical protein